MTAAKRGRPRNPVLTEAVRRVLEEGLTPLQACREAGIKNSQQVYNAVRAARQRQQSESSA